MVPDGKRRENEMTQQQNQQQDQNSIQPEAVELDDAQLEQANGGAIYMKVDGIVDGTSNASKPGVPSILDGLSH